MDKVKYISGNRYDFTQFEEYTTVFINDSYFLQIKPGKEQRDEFIDDLEKFTKKHRKIIK